MTSTHTTHSTEADATSMRISGPDQQELTTELAVMQRVLPLEGASILELGCGGADKTRMIAEHYPGARIVAAEVDPIAHEKNLAIDDLPNVTFASFGAESIPLTEASFDIVLMFKSLHHVPLDCLARAFDEMRRVLKPGGRLYVSEPVFAGAFNEIVRLFHDEERVRRAAFDATVSAVASGRWTLADEVFFENHLAMQSFAQFERGILNATFMDHQLSPELLEEVRAQFESHRGPDGYVFRIPNRVDVLERV